MLVSEIVLSTKKDNMCMNLCIILYKKKIQSEKESKHWTAVIPFFLNRVFTNLGHFTCSRGTMATSKIILQVFVYLINVFLTSVAKAILENKE